MDIELMKKLGNIDQIAGVRQVRSVRDRGTGTELAEFYNAAGLRFSVIPDRCSDIFDCSYKGINLSFQSKNGLVSAQEFDAAESEFLEQWSAGMLVTCGLDNVGDSCDMEDGRYPAHGRIGHIPAKYFGAEAVWENGIYKLRSCAEVHQTMLNGRHLSLRRTVETELYGKTIQIRDVITNHEAQSEPYMLLYHCNMGYPLLDCNSRVAVSSGQCSLLNGEPISATEMQAPIDGCEEELYLYTQMGPQACGVLYNEDLELGVYVLWDTQNLPNMLQWKMIRSHDYVLALEPCNTWGLDRKRAIKDDRIAVLPAYSSVENHLTIGVLEGLSEIRGFLKNL